ncbi:MAG TPA: hypothetical protein VJH24_03565 [Candidatus Bilamarchaeaceae archaeon]|nr:hypothetical protein [Candidatus Bilamarchaeaceae archaeon]
MTTLAYMKERGCGRRPPIATMPDRAPQTMLRHLGHTEPPMAMQTPPTARLVQERYGEECKKYEGTPGYGKVLRGGWPGVRGEVRLGRPMVNRTKDGRGEVVVVWLDANRYPHSRSLGPLPAPPEFQAAAYASSMLPQGKV